MSAKIKAIQNTMGVWDLITFDDIIINLRKKHWEVNGNIVAKQLIDGRKPLTPFNKQDEALIDSLYSFLI